MKSRILLSAMTLALVALATPARAQSSGHPHSDSLGVEITPFVGIGSGASHRIGAAIRFAWTQDLGVELETDYRDGEIHAISSSVGLIYDLPRLGRIVPYVTGGVGFEQYGTVAAIPGQGLIVQPRLAFTLNAGAGVRVPVNDRWGVRADARWSNGIGWTAPERWRVYNGVTFRSGGK